ncbi:MAG: hypothetical protein RL095_1129 [Verrucomicrobiota bacterium]|jgi:hypothetical protein
MAMEYHGKSVRGPLGIASKLNDKVAFVMGAARPWD